MTTDRRKISRMAFDAEHKRLMLAYRAARGGARATALKRLSAYVTVKLRTGQ